jgi:hypothetical protein
MVLAPFSNGPVVNGTMFWARNEAMFRRSKTGSNPIRPHLVINVVDNVALCCPMSTSSDAWNAEVSPHHIPYEVNPKFMQDGNKPPSPSLYAVNAWYWDGLSPVEVDWIETQRRIVVPNGFVRMANDLYGVFSNDVRNRRLSKVSKVRHKDRRITKSIRRIELTTEEVMKEFLPVWKR